ncbi:hypothetical protein GPALN_006654 [Globodera pallida]|nr:hypothetical protein GPALN_006654 [Globodera pallida]
MAPLRLLVVLLLVCAMFGMNQMALAHHDKAPGGRPAAADEAAVIRVRRMASPMEGDSTTAEYGARNDLGMINCKFNKKLFYFNCAIYCNFLCNFAVSIPNCEQETVMRCLCKFWL